MPIPRHAVLLLLVVFLFAVPRAFAQQPQQLEISGTYPQFTLIEILYTIEKQYPVKFYFYPDRLPVYRQTFSYQKTPLYTVLTEVLRGSDLTFVQYKESGVVIVPRLQRNRAYIEELVSRWQSGEIILPVSDAPQLVNYTSGDSTLLLKPGTLFTLSGKITEKADGQPVTGATIGRPGTPYGAVTDERGAYRIELPAGRQQVEVQYIGFQPVVIDLGLFADGRLDLALDIQPLRLGEIVVEAQAAKSKVGDTQIGLEQLSVRTIRELPSFLGEADVVKSLALLPGISTVGEGSSGFNVRGGNIDQNLIVQDGAPLYNSSHALGFFSIFNTDAIREVTLYKGNIPARFGGRTSSVLEVDLQDGDSRQFRGRGGIGLVSSRLLLQGPIWKEKTSFLLGGRTSYSNWILRAAENPDIRKSSAYFSDITGKLTHRFSERSSLALTGFWSTDYFRYAEEFGFNWRNLLFSAQWRQAIGPHLNMLLTATTGEYASEQFDPAGNDAFRLTNGISNYRIREHLAYSGLPNHDLEAGVEWHYQRMAPERVEPNLKESVVATREVARDQGVEAAVYLSDEWELSPKFSLSLGLRYSFFQNYGPREVYQYASDAPREVETIIDTLFYESGQAIARYQGPEPRLSLRYRFSPTQSFKAGYNRLRQYIHLISNTAAATPVDSWQLSNAHLPPQIADNYSFGYFQNIQDDTWEFSVEVFVRRIRNLVEFQDLPELLLNEHLETELLNGRGKAYGGEVFLKKNLGRWTGWVAYTFSRTLAQVAQPFSPETINRGKWFPAAFDQPHQITLLSRWQWNPKHSFTMNFVFRSGRPVTAPVGGYLQGTTYIPHYSPRNALRINNYHRLDIGYTFDNSQGRRKGLRGSLTLAIYNLYFRQNPFTVYFKRDELGVARAYRLAVLGTAFPAITYNFIF